jgi:UDP-GlcNAc:undecaprenyl-phosphate/decaprenyl-phosphate GlcNAc-1-phosphate transferase
LTSIAPLVLLVAALASLVITPVVIRVAVARRLYDTPDTRRLHTKPIPRLGGIVVFIATLLGLLAALSFGMVGGDLSPDRRQFFTGILLGGTVLFAAGLLDDLRGLRPGAKLLVQCVAAVIVYRYGLQIQLITLGPTIAFPLGWLALPLTVLWVVGVTNAFNVIDNMDGLATGLALVALATVLGAAFALGNGDVALVCLALTGALLGFLPYNFNPARIFLGDSGSLFIGFMLAVLSVHGALKSATAVLVAIPLFALAVPLFDLTLSILRRWLRGVPIFVGDTRHISHRLLAIGLTQARVVTVLSLVAGALGLLGLLLAFTPPPALRSIALAGGAVTLMLILYGMRHLNYAEFIEGRDVIASGLGRIRRIVHDQIYAREVAQLIPRSENMRQINGLLEAKAREFGFQSIQVARASALEDERLAGRNGRAGITWRLDHILTGGEAAEDDPFILRISCGLPVGPRPHGAERVARIVVPAIEEWLAKTKAPVRSPGSTAIAGKQESEVAERAI